MSETTNLKLKKHDNVTTNTNQFDIENYMNDNWDKVGEFAGQVNEKVIEIEDNIDLVKQRTEQAVEDINTELLNKASKEELQEARIALQAELLATKKDLQASSLEGQAEGESLYLQDSSDARFREFGIGGNSEQEKREGYNLYNYLDRLYKTQKDLTITGDNESGYVTVNGTPNGDYANIVEPLNITNVLKVGQTYTLWQEKYGSITNTGVYLQITERPAEGGTNRIFSRDNKKTITIKEGATYEITLLTGTAENTGTLTNYENRYMLYEGTEDKSYEKYGAMPSLGFSSEVEAVGQDINILNIEELVDGYIDDQGRFVTAHTMGEKRTDFIKVKPKATLTFKIIETNDKNTDWIGVGEYSNANISGFIKRNVAREKNIITFTTSETTEYIIVSARNLQNATKVVLKEENGDVKWSTYNHGSANVVVENKNKLDFSKWNNIKAEHGTLEQVENGIKLTATGDDCYSSTFAFKFQGTMNKERITKYGMIAKPNTEYTFSCKVNDAAISKRLYMFFADENYNSLGSKSSATSILTAITPTNCKYITVRVGVVNAGDSLTFTDLQLEKGAIATDYVEHKEQAFTVPVQQEMLGGDYFGVDGEHHVMRKIIVDGQNIKATQIKSTGTTIQFYLATSSIIKTDAKGYCNMGKQHNNYNIENTFVITRLGNLYMHFPVTALGDKEITDAYLNELLKQKYDEGTPLTFILEAKEEIVLPYTEPQTKVLNEIEQTLHSYKGGTHVYSTDAVSPIFNVKYTKDTEAYIKNEIANISRGVINNV